MSSSSCPPTQQCIISAAGKNFCAGLDLSYLSGTFGAKMRDPTACPGRLRDSFRRDILAMQVRQTGTSSYVNVCCCSCYKGTPALKIMILI